MTITPVRLLIVVIFALACVGCGSSRSAYDPSNPGGPRNIPLGEKRFAEAIAVLAEDPAQAEILLQKCLVADLYHGPAHNNLGVLLLKRGKLYDAAGEFAWAAKLLPGHPDPHLNLAIVLDRGGKTTDALASCRTALDVQPGYLPAIQAAALIQVREKVIDETTAGSLDVILARSENPQWREWAQRERLKLSAQP